MPRVVFWPAARETTVIIEPLPICAKFGGLPSAAETGSQDTASWL
jgi:hypothetical protein